MNPVVITIILIVGWFSFFWSAWLKFRALTRAKGAHRFDRIFERLKRTVKFAFFQAKLPRYPVSGIAHMFIFWGFLVLLLRSIILWGRGYDEQFSLWVFGDTTPGILYAILKDFFVLAVFIATTVAIVNRVVNRKNGASRMTHSFEAYLILVIIWAMMVADVLYDWGDVILAVRHSGGGEVKFSLLEPMGSITASVFSGTGLDDSTVNILRHAGYWGHVTLVLIFLNILPYSKHFHVITAIPNVFLQNLEPPGRIEPIENIYERETYGLRTIEDLTWKQILDLYTCTECGRCSDNCPAWTTAKPLSPKLFTVDLRNHLYKNLEGFIGYREPKYAPDVAEMMSASLSGQVQETDEVDGVEKILVPGVIRKEVVWSCTTCRACEDACPLFISYVDRIIELRRHLVLELGEIPGQLATALHGLETNYNPWNIAASDRDQWSNGLDVPVVRDEPRLDYLLWVGCAPAYDDRSKKVARAMVQLLKKAGVKFGILGQEERCTGDIARRAGNEALFEELARANIETLDKYGIKRIITICPHCYNTIANEYPDFGGNYLTISHVEFLLTLLKSGKLKLKDSGLKKERNVVYHDSCYLGRYNDIYEEPRQLLAMIPGLKLVECEKTRNRALCCGAGGAHAFKEEEEARKDAEEEYERVNYRRTAQLLETKPDVIATACPYCMMMLTDGLKAKDLEEKIEQKDIAEILLEYCK